MRRQPTGGRPHMPPRVPREPGDPPERGTVGRRPTPWALPQLAFPRRRTRVLAPADEPDGAAPPAALRGGA
ncbi:hypothetical protein, partial [Streptomonospora halophila]|uniref:hypothetical protein n=1 Tax=Streptomonospora halophila TaxID=427369 RepID=UPI0031F0A826